MGVNTQDLSDFKNDNVFDHNIESSMFVEEVSSTEFYIGYSKKLISQVSTTLEN